MNLSKTLIVSLLHILSLSILSLSGISTAAAQSTEKSDSILILEDEDEVIIGNKLFNKKNYFLTVGSGYGLYMERPEFHSNFGADIHVGIRNHFFTVGYFYTGRKYITESWALQLNDIHIGYGWRKERIRHNHYAFVGPSLAMGFQYAYTDTIIVNDEPKIRIWNEGFIQPGMYAEYQYTFKINYDMGIGLAAYTALSVAYQTVGLKAIIYLSTAYVGKTE